MRYETIKEATEAWVREFNAFPMGIIERINNYGEWREITLPRKYDKVFLLDTNERGEIISVCKNGKYKVETNEGKIRYTKEIKVIDDNNLPMWGTMWQFGDRIDDDWLSGEFGEDGLKLMSECGFRIYEHEEFGYFFGIDGAGYDFYEAHWIPLYKARGLHWHKEEAA